MARIQILELPSEEVGNVCVTPFAIIVDQYEGDPLSPSGSDIGRFLDRCGARVSLITPETIDIPGLTPEEMAAYGPRPHVGTATVDVVPNLMGFADAIRQTVEAIGPQKIGLYVGEQEVRDIVKAELAENTGAVLDALKDGRG